MNTNFTQTQLIEHCISKNRLAQKEMYDQFATKMYSVCLKYTKSQQDAEDVLQEGFIKLFNNLNKFRGDGSFEGWVRRIFVNTAIELLRKRTENAPIGENAENVFVSKNANALDSLYEKDIMRTSTVLSDGYKTVFTMYAVDGYSHKEIAQHLGITESTSKSQFSRAKAILRDMLQFHSKAPQRMTV